MSALDVFVLFRVVVCFRSQFGSSHFDSSFGSRAQECCALSSRQPKSAARFLHGSRSVLRATLRVRVLIDTNSPTRFSNRQHMMTTTQTYQLQQQVCLSGSPPITSPQQQGSCLLTSLTFKCGFVPTVSMASCFPWWQQVVYVRFFQYIGFGLRLLVVRGVLINGIWDFCLQVIPT